MLNERLTAARPIVKSLKNAEVALTDTVRQMGTLLVDISNAKVAKGTHFALDAGIAASERVALAAVSAIQSYQHMIAAHAHLAADRDAAGLKVTGFGDVCPPLKAMETDAAPALRVVGE